ncbi:MAG: T9SS type A sorting domain-containing protein, partial [Rhodothermales bacterium]|nr:T9SS type A sorting domain-containing protein [Rhodothermales bacterium]
ASECRERSIAETIQFEADDVVGSATELQPYTVTGATLQTINLVKGWTWISFGVEAANMSSKSVLSQLKPNEGDVIKGQTGFSQYVNGHGWVGTLDSLESGLTYKIQSESQSDLVFIGEPVDVDDHPIAIKPGWNWVGYLPDNSLSVDQALGSLSSTATNDDILKGQFAFATFSSGSWTGSLGTMVPGDGYLLRAGQTGSLVYPGASGQEQSTATTILANMMSADAPPEWIVNAAQFEKSMTITAALILDNGQSTNDQSLVAAFVGNELRGVAKPVFALDKWVFFLTVYGDTDGETVTFRAYDADRDQVTDILETVQFASEASIGEPRETKSLTSSTATSNEDVNLDELTTSLEQNYPNPVLGRATIPYSIEETATVNIEMFDALGRRIATLLNDQQPAGRYSISLDTSGLAGGLYLYRLRAGNQTLTRTLTVVK